MSSVLIEYNWAEPEPEIVAQQLIALSEDLENFIEPMTIAGELTRKDIKAHFQTGTDPSGRAWAPWAESYEPWALSHTTGPVFGGSANLHLTGGLEEAATSPGAFVPTTTGLFLDTSQLPEHWAWNNFGAYDRGTGAGTKGIAFYEEDENPNDLPERPFIGLSDAAKAKIDATFFAWFEGEIALGVSSRGTPFGRHSKRGGFPANRGQFSPRD